MYLILAITTYGYIFEKYKQSQEMRVRMACSGSSTTHLSVFQLFRQSNFYISTLIIATFIAFTVIPDFAFIPLTVFTNNPNFMILHEVWFSCRACSDLCDACIFIFMNAPVRTLLRKKCFCCCQVGLGMSPGARIAHVRPAIVRRPALQGTIESNL